MQLLRIILISMCMVVLGFIVSVYATHQGLDCSVCHDSVDTRNLGRIREVIETPNSGPMEVWFIAYEGWRSFADGDGVYDGVCEVCHTINVYHVNYGDGTEHFDGEDCTGCHLHENDFLPSFVVDQSHDTHFNAPKGPQISECTDCHFPGNYSLFADGDPLSTTTVCNPCHSPSGAFDGVNDTTIGAKPNWQDGIYEIDGSHLKPGKENWCVTCHDDGTSSVNGVNAPNVMGDNITYGFNVSGHGKYLVQCYDCHDLTAIHTDGDARTYSSSSDNYREGYRLNDDMAVPRNGEIGPVAFRLCTNCHVYSDITGPNSNFRDDVKGIQLHDKLLNEFPNEIACDSDWDSSNFPNDCASGDCTDSAITCIICHNAHGSPTPAMIRNGELISTPGTTDKVPALDFRWYEADGVTPTTILEDSRYGSLLSGAPNDISVNHVCWGCHTSGEQRWWRNPSGIPVVECNLDPDAVSISRGGTLGFQATAINNTDEVQVFGFATNVTIPGGGMYPPAGYLKGPIRVRLDPYDSVSKQLSQFIPNNAPLGPYTYHGYVGRPGVGIYDHCKFYFVVTE